MNVWDPLSQLLLSHCAKSELEIKQASDQESSLKLIDKLVAKVSGAQIDCTVSLTQHQNNAEFAYNVYRNEEKVHVAWYSEKPVFSYNTNGIAGYYRVVAFAKVNGEYIEQVKSNPIFANPIKVTPDAFPNIENHHVAYQLEGKRWSFPTLYYPSDSDSLFVMLPSAADRAKMVLPAFSRWTWAVKGIFPGSVLCIADPTLELSEDLALGWLIGDKDDCATSELAEFILKLARHKGVPNEKIVIYGSSAGGFAALALAACIDGATAVAINTQTHALFYENKRQVALVRRHCFNDLSQEQIIRDFPDRVNMELRWKNVKHSRAFLVQNETDTHHYEVHFLPFWKSLGGIATAGIREAGQHKAWLYHQEGGHIPESMEMAQKIISMLKS